MADKISSDNISKTSLSGLDKLFIIFFIWVVVAALLGLKNGGKQVYIISELYFFGFYLMYFIISRSFKSINSIKQIIAVLIMISVIVSFEYIYIAVRESGLSGGLLLKRVSTQQPHIAQITIPFLMSYYFFKKQKKVVLLVSIFLIPLFLMVFFSQQRGLWVGILISLIILWFLSFVEHGVTVHNLMKFVLYLFIAISLAAFILVVIDKLFMGSSLLTLITRANTLLDLSKDVSLSIRLAEINHALVQWRENIFLGTGLGSWISPVILSHMPENHIDNSYIFILWKTGVVGLFIFISIYAVFFKKAFYLFHTSLNSDVRQIAGAIIAAFSGLLIVALSNTCIIYYRFNVLWAVLIGLVEVMYRQEKKRQESDHG
ncbi:O-antigen ligase family protein [bacterium]|nr:O-antigen ligase family protein [bacterium]